MGARALAGAGAGRHDEDDAESLVLMADHAGNPRHPPQWVARSEAFACLNPAPFFSEELIVPDGETARRRQGVGIACSIPAIRVRCWPSWKAPAQAGARHLGH
ncbi:DUF6807 family protein [Streptomyces sp. 6N223]|uniref:DUF6807 family protein n=1 Tax=Streptomyces sp. 6N223 TaxID=3457412 RepID=UPI003FD472AF